MFKNWHAITIMNVTKKVIPMVSKLDKGVLITVSDHTLGQDHGLLDVFISSDGFDLVHLSNT